MKTQIYLALFFILLCFGCKVGEASFAGKIGDNRFDPSGTIYAHINDQNQLVIAMTWITFDPKKDLVEENANAFDKIKQEFGEKDFLILTFSSKDEVKPDAHYQTNEILSYRLQTEKTSALLGGNRSIDVNIDDVDLVSEHGFVSGSVDIWVKRDQGDPEGMLEGHVRGTFKAPLIKEPVAKQNLARLVS